MRSLRKRRSSKLKPVRFSFHAPQAMVVAVAGDFNSWDNSVHRMRHGRGGTWKRGLRLRPGRHEYRFVVDGTQWVDDPRASEYCPNVHGGRNAVIQLK